MPHASLVSAGSGDRRRRVVKALGRPGTTTWVGALTAVLWLSGSAAAAGAVQEGDTNNATVPTAVGRHREDLISADSVLGS